MTSEKMTTLVFLFVLLIVPIVIFSIPNCMKQAKWKDNWNKLTHNESGLNKLGIVIYSFLFVDIITFAIWVLGGEMISGTRYFSSCSLQDEQSSTINESRTITTTKRELDGNKTKEITTQGENGTNLVCTNIFTNQQDYSRTVKFAVSQVVTEYTYKYKEEEKQCDVYYDERTEETYEYNCRSNYEDYEDYSDYGDDLGRDTDIEKPENMWGW